MAEGRADLPVSERGLSVRASIVGEYLFLLGLAYLVESPLVPYAYLQIQRDPSLAAFWGVAGGLFVVAQLPMVYLLVMTQAVTVTVQPGSVGIEERTLRGIRRRRTLACRELRAVARSHPSLRTVTLRPANPAWTAFLSLDQARAVVRYPECPPLEFQPPSLRGRLLGPEIR